MLPTHVVPKTYNKSQALEIYLEVLGLRNDDLVRGCCGLSLLRRPLLRLSSAQLLTLSVVERLLLRCWRLMMQIRALQGIVAWTMPYRPGRDGRWRFLSGRHYVNVHPSRYLPAIIALTICCCGLCLLGSMRGHSDTKW